MANTNNNKETAMTYQQQMAIEYTLRLREVLSELPPFCRDFFRAIEPTTSPKTRISYAYDLRIFFKFLLERNPQFKGMALKDFTIDVLDQLLPVDIEEYQEYLKVYDANVKLIMNTEKVFQEKCHHSEVFTTIISSISLYEQIRRFLSPCQSFIKKLSSNLTLTRLPHCLTILKTVGIR